MKRKEWKYYIVNVDSKTLWYYVTLKIFNKKKNQKDKEEEEHAGQKMT